jgi:hypothetical protein
MRRALQRGMCLAGLGGCGSSASLVIISEFVASNMRGLRDVDGETSDWIELQNTGRAGGARGLVPDG